MPPLNLATVISFAALLLIVSGCKTVRPDDLSAWVGMPVEALDTHSFFSTIPMRKTISESGIEVRNYANGGSFNNCVEFGGVTGKGNNATYVGNTSCSTKNIVCNNIFYIKSGKIVEYAPTGQCFTDDTVRPEPRYQRLLSR